MWSRAADVTILRRGDERAGFVASEGRGRSDRLVDMGWAVDGWLEQLV